MARPKRRYTIGAPLVRIVLASVYAHFRRLYYSICFSFSALLALSLHSSIREVGLISVTGERSVPTRRIFNSKLVFLLAETQSRPLIFKAAIASSQSDGCKRRYFPAPNPLKEPIDLAHDSISEKSEKITIGSGALPAISSEPSIRGDQLSDSPSITAASHHTLPFTTEEVGDVVPKGAAHATRNTVAVDTVMMRIPILIAQQEIPIEVSHSLNVPALADILDLKWRIDLTGCHLLIDKKQIVAEGLLCPEIVYVANGEERVIATDIGWKKRVSFDYVYPPQAAKHFRKVYTFSPTTLNTITTHREEEHCYADEPFPLLRRFHIVSSEDLLLQQQPPKVELRVYATLRVEIFQTQVIPLSSDISSFIQKSLLDSAAAYHLD